ncbi:hypothetical protein GOL81_25390 [Sinorhizobium medicae]|uniref:hypothetical protein n=1 Tax=Sinorhizobium medicae TaxID=110321 RepID=UPI001297955C|nr:hypothetical protein [Sinorhizobium medicae]MDX0485289.1 hypothetical protein [Sinorhizobium medicae]MDX0966497.1 hypothetical protein [Sinorhizobium medicae]MDX1102682.1 hypothetical protein [Sinorhizobium medicae]MQV48259.1 hypothetical protein [Sinorhizobium medicae]MQV53871.1 hypothetical protein [Sinorhizobium medicae]
MPIITTKEGLNINPAHVIQFTSLRNGKTRLLLSTGGEQICELYSDVAELFIPVIPANPGFIAVFAERWEDGFFQYKHRSVIAWRLCPSGNYPIFEGYGDSNDEYAVIIDPAGGIYDGDGNVYATLEDWKKEYEAEVNELAARSAKAA